MIYLDDIVIFSKTQEEHIEHLDAVLQRLINMGLKLKPSKCNLFKREIVYLGHRVTVEGIHPDPKGISTVQEITAPKTVTGVRKFIRLISHYQKFIKGFANIARPLNKLVLGENAKKKKEKIVWTDECQVAFDKLKEASVLPLYSHMLTTPSLSDSSLTQVSKVLELPCTKNKTMEWSDPSPSH